MDINKDCTKEINICNITLSFETYDDNLLASNSELGIVFSNKSNSITVNDIVKAEFIIIDGWYAINAYTNKDSCITLHSFSKKFIEQVKMDIKGEYNARNFIVRFFKYNSYIDRLAINELVANRIRQSHNEIISKVILQYINKN